MYIYYIYIYIYMYIYIYIHIYINILHIHPTKEGLIPHGVCYPSSPLFDNVWWRPLCVTSQCRMSGGGGNPGEEFHIRRQAKGRLAPDKGGWERRRDCGDHLL